MYAPRIVVQNEPKRDVLLRCRFWEELCFKLERNFKKIFTDKLMSCNLKHVFTSPIRIESFFPFKDKLHKILLSGPIYTYRCGGNNPIYYSKTKRHLNVGICEHLGISYLAGKTMKTDNNKLRTIQEQNFCCN